MNNITLNACCDVSAQTMLHQNLVNRATSALNWLKRAYTVFGQRRALARLSDQQLRDIGVSREAAQREASRPFWDHA